MAHGQKECVNERKEVQGGDRLKEGSVAERAEFILLQELITMYRLVSAL